MNKKEFRGFWMLFNDRANLYLYGVQVNFKEGQTRTIEKTNGDVFRLTAHQAGSLTIYTFGLMCKEPKNRPGHGGEWSSNSECINKMFGTNIRECSYNQIGCAIDVEDMKQFMVEGITYEGIDELGFHKFMMEGTRLSWTNLYGEHFEPSTPPDTRKLREEAIHGIER